MEVSFKSYKSKLLLYSILLILLTLLSLSTPATRLIYPFLAILVVTVLFFILVIYILIRKLKWNSISKHILYFLVVIILSLTLQLLITRYQIKDTEKCGDELVIALNNYYEKNKRFPYDMRELIPAFTNKIPKSKMGLHLEEFHYTHKQNQSFNLSFEVDSFIRHYNTGQSNQWFSDN